MTNQAKEKAMNTILTKCVPLEDDIYYSHDGVNKAIDIALQEQAKEIKEMLEKYEKELLWVKAKNLLIFSDDWDKFWEKYGVKEGKE